MEKENAGNLPTKRSLGGTQTTVKKGLQDVYGPKRH
jgi:hypothetical protein